MPAHSTSCQASGDCVAGPEGVSGMGCGCGGTELGRTVEGRKRARAGPECRLEGRPFDPYGGFCREVCISQTRLLG